MSKWAKGADRVAGLIEARHLQQVIADPDTEAALLASAHRHVGSARRTASRDPEAAYSLAYDAARKSATALLSHQGLRPTTTGGHIAIVDVIRVQFPGVPGLSSLDRLRRRRNQAEYPDLRSYDPITREEAEDAIRVASDCLASTDRLLQLDELGIFRL
ncbi:MAG: HEPN domain-containing protein [Streptosporangiaceae bacterium]